MTSNPNIVEHFLNFMASFDESKRHLVNEFLESKKYKENKDGFNKAMMHILGDVNKENIPLLLKNEQMIIIMNLIWY